jgi:hypothetical protein
MANQWKSKRAVGLCAPVHASIGAAPDWAYFVVVAVVYLAMTAWNIDLPGVYMDAVNPDYLVAKILNPQHEPIVAWVLRGNYLLGNRAPVLIALYHGSHTFWLGLPFFWLFGTSVEGLRVTHGMFAIGVLAGLFFLLRRLRMHPAAATLTCVALALDPSFSYAFRTQSYITLLPDAWLLVAVALIVAPAPDGKRRWALSGSLAGLAVACYFIHAFFVPALLVAVWRGAGRGNLRLRACLRWGTGFLVGVTPLLLGYALLLRRVGSPGGVVDFFRDQQSSLGAFSSQLPLADRLAFAWRMVDGIVSNAWHHSMMFGEWTGVPGSEIKLLLLIGVPYGLWIGAEAQRISIAALRVILSLPLSFALVALVFGDRLGGHHYVTVLPLLYAGLVVALQHASTILRSTRVRNGLAALVAVVGLVINVQGQVAESRRLQETRGVGLMSDAINRFAADLNGVTPKPFLFLADWGLSIPVVFLTRGSVGMSSDEDFALGREMICSGRDVAVALVNGDWPVRIAQWRRELQVDERSVKAYDEASGKTVFLVVTFSGNPTATVCGRSK